MSDVKSEVLNLPIMKHYEGSAIKTEVDKFRKGEKSLFWFLKLGALCAVGYGLWVYVLPVVFVAVGQLLATAATIVIAVALIIAAPVIIKGIRRLTRLLHKALIKHDPFAELAEQRNKMEANKVSFQRAKGKITQIQRDMENESKVNEKKAKEFQSKLTQDHAKAQQLRAKLEAMVQKEGQEVKLTDEYVLDTAELQKLLSGTQRVKMQYEQANLFVQKYGARGAVMKKMGHRLILVETAMENKLLDFDATLEMLKKDYEFARKSNEATTAAKSALGLTTGWELEYALDVVATTIAEDIAITTGNLRDIESLTANFDMNSDEMFAQLDILADEINTGKSTVTDSKKFRRSDYRLTEDDKAVSGGFGDMF